MQSFDPPTPPVVTCF